MDLHSLAHASSPLRTIGLIAVVLIGTSLCASGARAQSTPQQILAADQVGAGELLMQTDAGLVPLPIVDITVNLDVTGIMLRGRVEQTFTNPTDEVIDAIYAFPLPTRAALHHMEIRVGNRRIVATVQEKHQAQKTYETAKAQGRTAALVRQDFGSLFTTKAANIGPGETIRVVLEYLEEVTWVDSGFQLRFPLTYVPRFAPPTNDDVHGDIQLAGGVPNLSSHFSPGPFLPSATVRVTLDTGLPLAAVSSRSHAIHTDLRAKTTRVVTDPGNVSADRDFLLRWKPNGVAAPEPRVLIEDRVDGRYGLLMLLPPTTDGDIGQGLATETLFIVDVSGSMSGPPLRQAREALLAALDRLRPEDRFNIMKFSDRHSTFAEAFVHAEGDDLANAKEWVRHLSDEGGTMILPALVAGMDLLGQSRSTGQQRIVFLTDGAISNETQVLDAIVQQLGEARLHTIGIGHAPNSWLMRKMAAHGHGLCTFISDVSGAQNDITRFFRKIERPVLANVALEWDGTRPRDLFPPSIPDLYDGDPLYLSFKLEPGEAPSAITLRGHSRIGAFEHTTRLPRPEKIQSASNGLALRWAHARVGSLMDSLHEGADADFVRGEVVDVALDFNLVTLYTSLVAVDHGQVDTQVASAQRIAASLPQGGTDSGLRWWVGWVLLGIGMSMLPLIVRNS